MRVNHDFGEGLKLYSCELIGSSWHCRQTEKQPNGLWHIVPNTVEYKVGIERFKELFPAKKSYGTKVW